ncbi:CcoQ/FixQ family Cbb3-type cytochrome c oxidase assembly chaperone [Chryseobacterium sp. MEBOG06]|uniref:CcoQ/FixQ family Cbb3-type cytochrome c oxidase assembly chaperone n=1 Tax=Chryseobacterium sp. TaxID=1871047 RepID=UPI001F18D79B|nr:MULTISPECIES: CcoQ/FixQ family Cbb3-type cytochrome c oxidase assembly chaperone [unclassified Chryseobacterium]UKB85957.1 CcoQ/FixQ family Cbb3-type cytochrome c oxidase assembly chaperone [Chryseobacterium sp. MEBOG06]
MIPQNFKDFLANTENTGLYQMIALIFFFIFFTSLILLVFSKPKKYYKAVSELPLDGND